MTNGRDGGLSPRVAALAAARREGLTLAQEFYTDPEVFEADLKFVFGRHWLFAGHESLIPRTGDYFTLGIGRESVLIVRGGNSGGSSGGSSGGDSGGDSGGGQVRAMHNVCRHRGSLVCTQERGSAKKLVCPYHQWVYDLDGRLQAAKYMPEGFDAGAYGLLPVHCGVVGGLIFINLSENPDPFEPFASAIGPHIAPHGLDRAKVCHTRRYTVRSNWKLVLENARECYHCMVKHPEYSRRMLGPITTIEAFSRTVERRVEECRPRWEAEGLWPKKVFFDMDRPYQAHRYPFAIPGGVTNSLDGKPVGPLMGSIRDADIGVVGILRLPGFMIELSCDHAVSFQFLPIDAVRTSVRVDWYVRGDAVEGRDYDVERVSAMWRITGEQDWTLCEDNQRGVESPHYVPGPYGAWEDQTDKFVRWYLRQLQTPAS